MVNLRLKRNGAWWKVCNAQAILALRAAKLFGAFDDVWERRISKRCAQVPAQLREFLATVAAPQLTPRPRFAPALNARRVGIRLRFNPEEISHPSRDSAKFWVSVPSATSSDLYG
ncbi:MAG: hypothetical protein HY716_03520 [Planctomycetes bacterium]|nr:hypothetical protein [Planctomycetota bacterium]